MRNYVKYTKLWTRHLDKKMNIVSISKGTEHQ